LEDSRFTELPPVYIGKVDDILCCHLDQEEYLVDEIIAFTHDEVRFLQKKAEEAHELFTKATDHIIYNDRLGELGIPSSFQEVIKYTWANRITHPFLYGRFDFSGGIDGMPTKVIEYNADTCTMVTETLFLTSLRRSLSC